MYDSPLDVSLWIQLWQFVDLIFILQVYLSQELERIIIQPRARMGLFVGSSYESWNGLIMSSQNCRDFLSCRSLSRIIFKLRVHNDYPQQQLDSDFPPNKSLAAAII